MREILYIQAGSLANHVGTHFWNTQASYFTYDNSEEVLLWHDISFREGLDHEGTVTYCPRLLSFDRKANFGAIQSVMPSHSASDLDMSLWTGEILEIRQPPIRSGHDSDQGKDSPRSPHFDEIKYWSDFSRVDYLPRSIQALPDVADWEQVQGGWTQSQQMFTRYDEETSLLDGPVRLFLEECNSIQGLHVLNDTSTFGGFMHSFLTQVRDEVRSPVLAFPFLSDHIPSRLNIKDQKIRIRNLVNDALYLRTLNELSSLSIPIQSPSNWSELAWTNTPLSPEQVATYHTSAVVSAHIESSTLPLKGTHEDIASFVAQLNCTGGTPFGQLSGIFPVSSLSGDLERGFFDFSTGMIGKKLNAHLTRRDVTRGLSKEHVLVYEKFQSSYDHCVSLSTTHAMAYPIPPSFPQLTDSWFAPGVASNTSSSARVLSSLTTGGKIGSMIKDYASYLEEYIQRHGPGIGDSSAEEYNIDDLKELVHDLWGMHDNCGVVDNEWDSVNEDDDD